MCGKVNSTLPHIFSLSQRYSQLKLQVFENLGSKFLHLFVGEILILGRDDDIKRHALFALAYLLAAEYVKQLYDAW